MHINMKSISKASAFLPRLFSSHFILLLLTFFFISCVTPNIENKKIEHKTSTHPAITHTRVQNSSIVYHLTTIQLNHPSVVIDATAPVPNKSYTTLGQTTKDFAQSTHAHVAINASPYSYPTELSFKKRTIEGIYIYKGSEFSPANENYAALSFSKDKKASITASQKEIDEESSYFSFGGFFIILDENKIIEYKDIKDARTAVGVSEDGYTLFILSVEKNKTSLGLNYMECAKILQESGANKALQLDGGGSVSLIFPHAPEQSIISNRRVANSIGFYILSK